MKAFIAMGVANSNRKNYQECVNTFEEALKIEPQNKVAKKLTSICKRSLNDLRIQECLSDYEEQWRQDPKSKVVKARIEYCKEEFSSSSSALKFD